MNFTKTLFKTKEKRDNFCGMLMIIPGLIFFVLLVMYPTLWALKYVFYEYDGFTSPTFVGTKNIVRLFTRETVYWRSILFTVKYVATKLVIEFPLAVLLGAILSSKVLRTRSFFRGVYFMPVILSSAVMSVVFSFIFSPYNGLLNATLMKIGVINGKVDWLSNPKTAFWCCVALSVWSGFGQNTILTISGIQGIPEDIYESASIDGAGAIVQFFKITLPILAPILKTILMLMLVGSFGGYESIYVLTGGGPNHATEVMSLTVYNQFFKAGMADYGYGATLGIMSAVITGIITVVYLFMSRRLDKISE